MTDNSQEESAPITIRNTSRRVSILRILPVIAIAGLVIWLWKNVLEDRLILKRWGVVRAGKIYRSGRLSAALATKTLRKNNIAVIVDLTGDEPDDKDQHAEKKAAVEPGIERLRFPLKGDGTGDINNYAKLLSSLTRCYVQPRAIIPYQARKRHNYCPGDYQVFRTTKLSSVCQPANNTNPYTKCPTPEFEILI